MPAYLTAMYIHLQLQINNNMNETIFNHDDENSEIEFDQEELIKKIRENKTSLSGISKPCSFTRSFVSNELQELLKLAQQDDIEIEAGKKLITEIRSEIKERKVKLSYNDLCILFKTQGLPGDYYPITRNSIGFKVVGLMDFYLRANRTNLNVQMAAIFSGYENYLSTSNIHIPYYYALALKKGKPHPYFRENSLEILGISVPYHAVCAAVKELLPNSIYAQPTICSEKSLGKNMLGFPRAWAHYTWDRFVTEYPKLFEKFRKKEGRDFEPSDLIIAGLTHTNKYHGLVLMNRKECSVLDTWIETLAPNWKNSIDQFEKAKWVKIE
jgi:hypothetical protein